MILIGNDRLKTEDFLSFDFAWENAAKAKGPELQATWASLSIKVGSTVVTEFVDKRSKSLRSALYLPLYPLAEWIADNWWFLAAEVDRVGKPALQFERRHNIRYAREGFALPSLTITKIGECTRLAWNKYELSNPDILFNQEGDCLLKAASVRQSLYDFVEAVITRLLESGISDTPLQEQWAGIQETDEEEIHFCETVARLGVDPYAIDNREAGAVVLKASKIRPELVDDFFSLVDSSNFEVEIDQLNEAANTVANDDTADDSFSGIKKLAPRLSPMQTPWETGYEYASMLRKTLGTGMLRTTTFDDMAKNLQINNPSMAIIERTSSVGKMIDAVIGVNKKRKTRILLNKQLPASKKFVFCRALFDYLTLPEGSFSVISKLKNEQQQMNRAFAAEILVPHQIFF